MSIYICKKLSSHLRSFTTFSPVNKLLHFQCNYISSSSAISSITNSSNQESFKVSYLINSCGLTQEQALSASKRVKLKTPEPENAEDSVIALFKKNADSVIDLFKKHGFTDTQISTMVKKLPLILLSDCENTILPKLEYFASIGFSSTILTNFVSASPHILGRSLENVIIPTRSFFKSLLKTNEITNIATRRFLTFGWPCDIEARVIPNIRTLRELGVKESAIVYLLVTHPSALKNANDRFKITVEKVKQMGFNPQQVKFVLAVNVLSSLSKSTWEKKVEILKKWGWSEDDVYVAFTKHPLCMTVSADKISSVMDMFINKSGFDPSDIVQSPECLLYSLEKRVVPRCLFYQVLLKRGLITKKWSLGVLVGSSDKKFMKKITMCYKEAAPELLKLYQEKFDSVTNRGLEV